MRAQGALEYLIIIAAVLGISAVVVLFVSGAFSGSSGGADLSKCRLAAANCKKDMAMGLSSTCPACDTACKDVSGKDLLDGRTDCGLACLQCKQGTPVGGGSAPGIGLAAYWNFDDATGTIADDSSTNSNDLALSPGAGNLVTLAGFESGPWGFVGDCGCNICSCASGAVCSPAGYNVTCTLPDTTTCELSANVSRDSTEGTYSLNLTGRHSKPCNARGVNQCVVGKSYTLGFMVKYVSGDGSPEYCMWINGRNVCEPAEILDSSYKDGLWHFYRKDFTVQTGSTGMSIFFYATSSSSVQYSTNLYDDAQVTEGPVWAPGRFGRAVFFDGANDYLNRTAATGLSNSALTFSLWVKQNGTAAWFMHPIGIFGTHQATIYVNPGTYSYTYKFMSISGTRYEISMGTLDNNWHLLTIVFNGTHIRAYVDAAIKDETAAPGIIDKIDDSIFIGDTGTGSAPAGNYFRGAIDNVRIYNRALTQTEIAQIYSGG